MAPVVEESYVPDFGLEALGRADASQAEEMGEELMQKMMEEFEKMASDPDRFWSGTSDQRLEESSIRRAFSDEYPRLLKQVSGSPDPESRIRSRDARLQMSSALYRQTHAG